MAIGVVISGVFTGLLAVIAALTAGLPIWAVAILYPVMGTVGALGFVGSLGKSKAIRFPRFQTTVQGEAAR